MIYSRFGTPLTLISKKEDSNGRVSIQATSDGKGDVREYHVGDLKADEGPPEIEQAVAKLPLQVFPKKVRRIR